MTIIFFAHDCNMTFIANELRFLLASEKVKEVKVYTDFPIEDEGIAFHDKCTVFIYGKIYQSALNMPFISIALNEVLGHFFWYLRRNKWTEVLITMRDHLKKATLIKENGIPDDAILYSYWAGSGAFIISCLKRFGIQNLSLSRLHAFDIYEGGDNHGHIPWRSFVLRQLDRLVTISGHGKCYLNKKYPFTAEKTHTHRLGIAVHDEPLNQAPVNEWKLVSCSWVGRRKNLTGVFDALQGLENTTWTHLGDGEDFEALKSYTQGNPCLKVQLPGRFTQKGLREYYAQEPTTCFISLSTNEGLPVSMMEAMAFGIPVVSTDVGGCAEIVTPETGVLLPKNYTNDDVVAAVKQCAEKFASTEARKHIQQFIRSNFDAGKNYQQFVDFLEQENKKHLTD
jgi:glycosyltransferase involved in cell wall biosynthesis